MDLSIIIVNYNTKNLTAECAMSLGKYTRGIKYEIIVVDNASSDGSQKVLRNLNLKLIENKQNLGFGKANNQGIKVAKGKYILLMNSDTLIHSNLLGEMVIWMTKNSKAGVATCALKNKDGSLQATGGYFPTLPRVIAWMFFLDDLPILSRIVRSFHPHTPDFFGKDPSYLEKHELDWITGAFFLVRRKVLDQIGYFDNDYFMYVEEVDLCWRAKIKGWKVWYLPEWSITHFGSASSNYEFPIISEYKGLKIFYKKHMSYLQYQLLRVLLKIGAILRIIILGLLKGKSHAKTYVKAFQIA